MLDANVWRMDLYLSMVDRPEQEQEHEEETPITFYEVTDCKELPF